MCQRKGTCLCHNSSNALPKIYTKYLGFTCSRSRLRPARPGHQRLVQQTPQNRPHDGPRNYKLESFLKDKTSNPPDSNRKNRIPFFTCSPGVFSCTKNFIILSLVKYIKQSPVHSQQNPCNDSYESLGQKNARARFFRHCLEHLSVYRFSHLAILGFNNTRIGFVWHWPNIWGSKSKVWNWWLRKYMWLDSGGNDFFACKKDTLRFPGTTFCVRVWRQVPSVETSTASKRSI